MEYDLIIVGAGVSGMAAAYRASQLGARVALLEKDAFLGGVATKAFHVTICGLFANSSDKPFEILNPGAGEMLVDDLIGAGVARRKIVGKSEILLSYPGAINSFFSSYFENSSVDIFLQAEVIELENSDDKITKLIVQGPDGELELIAQSFIDCSGCAYLSQISDAPLIDVAQRQLGALCAKVIDVDTKDTLLPVVTSYHIRKIVEELELFPEMSFSVMHGSYDGYVVLKLSFDPSRDFGQALKAANRLFASLGMKVDAWAGSKVLEWSTELVCRDNLRMQGKAVLEHKAVLEANTAVEGKVRGAWPIEYWYSDKGPRYEYLEDNSYYIVPDDSMRSLKFKNLFAAGKSLSADSFAMASARVIGIAIASGERAAELALGHQ